nr:hypothetical protein [Tanacetum cinerariifolium]
HALVALVAPAADRATGAAVYLHVAGGENRDPPADSPVRGRRQPGPERRRYSSGRERPDRGGVRGGGVQHHAATHRDLREGTHAAV